MTYIIKVDWFRAEWDNPPRELLREVPPGTIFSSPELAAEFLARWKDTAQVWDSAMGHSSRFRPAQPFPKARKRKQAT